MLWAALLLTSSESAGTPSPTEQSLKAAAVWALQFTPRVPDYAELRCISNFTFLKGASRPEELVERAKELGYAALALVDECSMAGVVRAHVAAKEQGLKLLIGSQFRVEHTAPFKLVLLATNLHGYGDLCQFITNLRRESDKGSYRQGFIEVVPNIHPGLINVELWNIAPEVNIGGIDLPHCPEGSIVGNVELELDVSEARNLVSRLQVALVEAERRADEAAQDKQAQE